MKQLHSRCGPLHDDTITQLHLPQHAQAKVQQTGRGQDSDDVTNDDKRVSLGAARSH
jgi:hypothetical protein